MSSALRVRELFERPEKNVSPRFSFYDMLSSEKMNVSFRLFFFFSSGNGIDIFFWYSYMSKKASVEFCRSGLSEKALIVISTATQCLALGTSWTRITTKCKEKVGGREKGKGRGRERRKGKGNWKWSFGRNGKNCKRPPRQTTSPGSLFEILSALPPLHNIGIIQCPPLTNPLLLGGPVTVAIVHHARTERIVNEINAKVRFLAQTKGRRERERERKRKGKEKGKGKLEVKLWQKRKKSQTWWINGRASATLGGVPGSIPGWGVFFRFCQSFTSNFPFPFSFPFLFLPLSLSLRPFV